jgi:hypothetical protein
MSVLYCHHIYYKELNSNLNINVSYSNKLYMHIFEHLRHCSSDSLVLLTHRQEAIEVPMCNGINPSLVLLGT